MRTSTDTLDDHPAPTTLTLTDLAAQLREGPLQELLVLQAKATELADRLAGQPADRIEDLEGIVRLSLSAMEQFHAFTREFAAVLRELTDAQRARH
jgi:hypothetical protein